MTKLQQYLNRWLDHSERRSLPMLANYSNVSYQSLYRFSRGRSKLNEEQIINLSMVVCKSNEERSDVICESAPHLMKIIGISSQDLIPQFPLHHLYESAESFWVICLSSKESGTTREEIQALLGIKALYDLDVLISEEVVSIRNERIFLIKSSSKVSITDPHTVKKAMKHLLDKYVPTRKKPEQLFFLTEGVSIEGYNKIYEILESAKIEIHKVSEKHKGDINLFCSLLLNSLGELK